MHSRCVGVLLPNINPDCFIPTTTFSSLQVSGDPRKPQDARKYKRDPNEADEQPPDFMLLLALVCGMFALLLRVWQLLCAVVVVHNTHENTTQSQIKAAAWAALLCCLSSFANMNRINTDVKQLVSSATYAFHCART